MRFLENGGILLHNGGSLLYNEGTVDPIKGFYYGIIDSEERPTPDQIATIELLLNPDVFIQNEIEVVFPQEIGWPVLVYPYYAADRISYFIQTDNRGYVLGSHDDFFSNLFPIKNVFVYKEVMCKLYIGSYITYFEEPVLFRSFI